METLFDHSDLKSITGYGYLESIDARVGVQANEKMQPSTEKHRGIQVQSYESRALYLQSLAILSTQRSLPKCQERYTEITVISLIFFSNGEIMEREENKIISRYPYIQVQGFISRASYLQSLAIYRPHSEISTQMERLHRNNRSKLDFLQQR